MGHPGESLEKAADCFIGGLARLGSTSSSHAPLRRPVAVAPRRGVSGQVAKFPDRTLCPAPNPPLTLEKHLIGSLNGEASFGAGKLRR